ncbi:MAG TPA: MOSC N-terminal beta barrel domain-containing protein [Mycobacteriales bacterium]|nr:MOSC N-terminal beta barrel domain-containing protein [Mycobacteriales bacterium]
MSESGGRVAGLYRYPVKSLAGERVEHLDCDERGFVGDRVWSVRTANDKIGSGKNTRRFAAVDDLLLVRARLDGDRVELRFPDGRRCDVTDDEAAAWLSTHSGEPLRLAPESTVSHFDDGPVSLLGLDSVGALSAATGREIDPARFRANVLLDGLPALAEDDLVGQHVAIGDLVLEVTMRSTRCVMIDMATADLPAQPGNLLAVGDMNEACLGVIARVVQPGRVRLGDRLVPL